jgi:hypothetical protein
MKKKRHTLPLGKKHLWKCQNARLNISKHWSQKYPIMIHGRPEVIHSNWDCTIDEYRGYLTVSVPSQGTKGQQFQVKDHLQFNTKI